MQQQKSTLQEQHGQNASIGTLCAKERDPTTARTLQKQSDLNNLRLVIVGWPPRIMTYGTLTAKDQESV